MIDVYPHHRKRLEVCETTPSDRDERRKARTYLTDKLKAFSDRPILPNTVTEALIQVNVELLGLGTILK